MRGETRKELGKITSCEFGFGGYQDAMMGLKLSFLGPWGGCGSFISGGWQASITVGEYTKWTDEERNQQRVEMVEKIDKILSDAKVDSISQLKGMPVECEIEGNTIKDWRILTEVL
jgi:hypothetical protein